MSQDEELIERARRCPNHADTYIKTNDGSTGPIYCSACVPDRLEALAQPVVGVVTCPICSDAGEGHCPICAGCGHLTTEEATAWMRAALAASPSPEISDPTKRMEKILDAPFVRRDASPTSLQNPQTSAPVVGDEGRREQNALALINEARRFSGRALISKLDELEPHQYRDQLRYADAIISPASISPVGDGAERCHRCGGNNPPWSAPSPLWNAIMRGGSIDGDALYGDMVCARCFMAIAEEKGIAKGWRVMAIDVRVDLETTTPAGRVWDAEQWLWVEPVEQIAENANCSDG